MDGRGVEMRGDDQIRKQRRAQLQLVCCALVIRCALISECQKGREVCGSRQT